MNERMTKQHTIYCLLFTIYIDKIIKTRTCTLEYFELKSDATRDSIYSLYRISDATEYRSADH